MIAHGEIEPVEAAIFADTGWEPRHVYEWLDWLEKQLPFPVYQVQHGNLRADTLAKRGGKSGICAVAHGDAKRKSGNG